MTNNDELALKQKFQKWFKAEFHPDITGPYVKDQMFFAWRACHEALLAERDADKKRIEMLEKYVKERDEENQGLLLTVGMLHTKLEARTVSVKLPKPHAHLIWIQAGRGPDDYWDDVAVSHSLKDRCCDGSERYPVYSIFEIQDACAAAGIKLDAGE